MKFASARVVLYAAMLLLPVCGQAQDAALDDKLRDLLHQTITQLRAAQDNASSLQTALEAMTLQRDRLQQQIAAMPAKSEAVPPAPGGDDALRRAAVELTAARAQTARAAADAQRLQSAYQTEAAHLRAQDLVAQRAEAARTRIDAAFGACTTMNTQLVALAGEILHLYETPQFDRLLVSNHERLIGLKRVQLQNLVQNYEDKIAAQTLIAPPAPAPVMADGR